MNRTTTFTRARPRLPIPQTQQVIASQELLAEWLGREPSTTVPVSDTSVRGLPAAWRSLNLIANGVAMMTPPQTIAPDGVTPITSPPIVARPNAGMIPFDFWHMAVATAIARGEFVGILADFDPAGYARQVVPVPPDAVSPYYDAAGYAVYDVAGELLSAEQVVHVRYFTVPGELRGLGVVEVFRRQLAGHLDQQGYSASTYRTGAVPSGIIELDAAKVDKTQSADVGDQWVERFGGGNRRPAVLPRTMKFTPLAWSPEDAQFLEARQMSVAETAFMFQLDPSDLAATIGGASQVYANIEQHMQQRIAGSYGPLMRRFEESWSDLTPGGNFVRFAPKALLRTDAKTTAEVDEIDIRSGVITTDEARAARGLGPKTAGEPAPTEENPAP